MQKDVTNLIRAAVVSAEIRKLIDQKEFQKAAELANNDHPRLNIVLDPKDISGMNRIFALNLEDFAAECIRNGVSLGKERF